MNLQVGPRVLGVIERYYERITGQRAGNRDTGFANVPQAVFRARN